MKRLKARKLRILQHNTPMAHSPRQSESEEEHEEHPAQTENPPTRSSYLSWMEISERLPHFVNVAYIHIIDRIMLRELMKRDTPTGDPYNTGKTWFFVSGSNRSAHHTIADREHQATQSWPAWITPWFVFDNNIKMWRVEYYNRETFFAHNNT